MRVSELAVGDLVQALPGCELEDIYAPGDEGTVQATFVDDDRIHIVWSRSGRACSVRKLEWDTSFSFIRKQELDIGDVVKVLPGLALSMQDVEFYRSDDEGIVTDTNNEDVIIAWQRTGQQSTTTKGTWMTFCYIGRKQADLFEPGMLARIHSLKGAAHLNGEHVTLIRFESAKGRWLVRCSNQEERLVKPSNLLMCTELPLQLAPADVVEVKKGMEISGAKEGEQGTVQGPDGDGRLIVVWKTTGEATSMRKVDALSSLQLVTSQVLEVGDLVEALPGIEVSENGRECYVPGDKAGVIGFAGDAGAESVRLLWTRTSVTSELPKKSWMSFCFLLEKGGGVVPERIAAGGGSIAAPQLKKLEPGQRCTLRGLQSQPERNGMTVLLERWESSKGRWFVVLETDELVVEPIKMLVKPVNLVP